jgi:AcrR family transcriptional regulator
MDAVEAIMRETGYAAVTARGVAARAGLKYQLVFYYFEGMDELLLAAFQRRTRRVMENIERALASPRPLHAFWEVSSEPSDAALTMEYLGLANHNEAIRAETVKFGEVMRQFVADRLAGQLQQQGLDPATYTSMAVSRILANIGAILGVEAAVGISGGHDEIRNLVSWCIQLIEPEPGGGGTRVARPIKRLVNGGAKRR